VAIIIFLAIFSPVSLEDWQASKKNGHPKMPACF